jgi:hypothetical protein
MSSDHSISSFLEFGGATASVPADATAFRTSHFGWMYSLDSGHETGRMTKVIDYGPGLRMGGNLARTCTSILPVKMPTAMNDP